MRATFHLKTLAVAIATLSIASMSNAAGLDRSGQDITAFLQDGTYAEAVYTYIDADVSGFDNRRVASDDAGYIQGNSTGDIAESYDFFRYGVKADVNDTFSVGILYDEPFGAAAAYTGDNNFTGAPTAAIDGLIAQQLNGKVPGQTITSAAGLDTYVKGVQQQLEAGRQQIRQGEAAIAANPALEPVLRPQINAGKAQVAAGEAQLAPLVGLNGYAAGQLANTEGTNVEVRSESITAIMGMKLGATKNFQIYGGPVAQRVQADVKLRGSAYGPSTGYTSHISPDQDYGYIVGASYSKPEIALKAALTYRSEIDHDMNISETYPLAGLLAGNPAAATQTNTMEITTPKSVNFDFQTGVNPTTLATAKVRWVPWGDFKITPPLYNEVSKNNPAYGPDGLALVEYDEDQWQVELGIAKRLAPALAVSGTVGWDSGAGDPTTSLGPVDGYYSVGLGAKYNVTPEWAVSAGGKYLWFGDAKGQLPTKQIVGDFQDNDGYILGMKLSYQGK
ncbi:outer membrane protein transport protein [Psychrobacter sp. DD43]|uniref:outer membrane protein transport protein n=1 Tax=Psychrobacter sp. DD43 TaxID=2774128 RepID=UPI001917FBA4|nr:outer membrane protein transport protein [Psychrobacter sp. DD43]